jgi:hypothetical protein
MVKTPITGNNLGFSYSPFFGDPPLLSKAAVGLSHFLRERKIFYDQTGILAANRGGHRPGPL